MWAPRQNRPVRRLLVVMPSWLGDTVMATPTLRALRQLYPDAHIAALTSRSLRAVLRPCPWVDRILTTDRSGGKRVTPLRLARRLAAGRFDMAVLLPNSFRSALLMAMAKILRRVGYDRDGRGWLLTDRLKPRRAGGRFVPVPTIGYYLDLARHLGAVDPDASMTLATRPADDERARRILTRAGVAGDGSRPFVLLNPGASYGDAKMWYPDRFAAVADRCAEQFGAAVAVSGAPSERPVLDAVKAAARTAIVDLPEIGIDLTLLKSVVRQANLMITNDTGPRHIAAAFGVPVVTIFGPTDPVWAEIDFEHERQVRVDVFCSPCQKKRCPIDHRCMTQVTAEMVFARAAELLGAGAIRP